MLHYINFGNFSKPRTSVSKDFLGEEWAESSWLVNNQ